MPPISLTLTFMTRQLIPKPESS